MLADGLSLEEINIYYTGGGSAGNGEAIGKMVLPSSAELSIISAVAPEGMTPKPKIIIDKKLKALHWSKLKPSAIFGTIWHIKNKSNEYELASEEVASIEEWFTCSVASAPVGASSPRPHETSNKSKGVIDGARTQKVLIMMGRLKLSSPAIVRILIGLNPDELTAESTDVLLKIMPTEEELSSVLSVDASELDNVGQLFAALSHIPRLEQRLKCHEIILRWAAEQERCALNLSVLDAACVELTRSEHLFSRILQIILTDGNYLNGGSSRGQAYGVKIDVLFKLSAVKGNPPPLACAPPLPLGGLNLINFIATQAEANDKELLTLSDGWTAMWAASDLSIKQIEREINSLKGSLNQVKTELKTNLSKIREQGGQTMAQPLETHFVPFVADGEVKLAALHTLVQQVTKHMNQVAARFGEVIGSNDGEEDEYKQFFMLVSRFAHEYKSAADLNVFRREEAVKAQRRKTITEETAIKRKSAIQERMMKANDADAAAAAASALLFMDDDDDIFAQFHSQNADDAVLDRTKMRRKVSMSGGAAK